MTDKKNQEIIDDYDYLGKAASARDCTGLIPTPADSFEERQSYQEIYPFMAPLNHTKDKK
ncbi:MAG: hypothetical protein ACRC3H_20970 [Lachnospiraceae bacterium]